MAPGQAPTRASLAGREPVRHGDRPIGGTRSFDGHRDHHVAPPHRTIDHRYARPSYTHVHTHPQAHYHVPVHHHYRPWYTRWYVHPYYRWTYSTTVVVGFGFSTYAWVDTWAPPVRAGWVWVPGYWSFGWWQPGYWAPVAPAPARYVYVPGWWEYEDVYVEGYYRVDERDGWEWVDGYYLEDGTYVRGHWAPRGDGPEGYVWEAGFYDGEIYVDGFWRPEYRSGYTWISSYYDEDGVLHGGYWQPTDDQPGYVWVPGWFDGNEWVEGYWVTEQDYESTDPNAWTPAEGWDDGWETGAGFGDGEVIENRSPGARAYEADEGAYEVEDELPLALPVTTPVEVED